LIASEPRSRRLGIVLFVLALVATGPALAEPSTAARQREAKRAAQEHLTRGDDLFTHDRYAEARAEFQAAFDAFPSPKLQFNLGQCDRALGRDDDAVTHFQRFLDEATDVSPALRAEAERYLAETRAHAAEVAPRDANVTAPVIVAPIPSPVTTALPSIAPPPPVVAAPVVEVTRPDEAARPRRSLLSRWWFWTAVGVVAVATAASIFLLTRPQDPACDSTRMRCFK
jgi:tetratricopeptide (TPR) repeat protein